MALVATTAVMLVVVAELALAAAPGSGFLPHDRAWEMVSPPDKNGGDIAAVPTRTQGAVGGGAVSFISLTAFGDAAGMGATAEYVSQRTAAPGTPGWATHSTLPKVEALSENATLTLSLFTSYQGQLSDDLGKGVFRTFTNLSDDPNLDQVGGLFLRNDLRTPGPGDLDVLSQCTACTEPLVFPGFDISVFTVLDATPDFGHVLFEAKYHLTDDAPPQGPACLSVGAGCRPLLYEWDHGTLRYVAILPDAEGGGPAIRSYGGVGQGGRLTPRIVSDDGSRIFFTVPPGGGQADGRLYMREDHVSTAWISESERTDCAGDPSCGGDDTPNPALDPGGEMPVQYQTASTDGSRVFFTSREMLTDAAAGGGDNLYMYDATLPDSNPHNLSLVASSISGFAGASEDGTRLYYFSELGDSSGRHAVMAWHDGQATSIGEIGGSDSKADSIAVGATGLESRVSRDGRSFMFAATEGEGLTGYDHGGPGVPGCEGLEGNSRCSEVYLYRAATDTVVCASCNPSGAPATADAGISLGIQGQGGIATGKQISQALSEDGTRVFFTSGERLVPGDLNGSRRDAYVYDAVDDSVHLLSSGRSDSNSFFLTASADGRDAFFATRERLSRWDVDDSVDVYDARVDGGLPEPPEPVAECEGDVCQGSPGSPGDLSLPGSFSLQGVGNDRSASRAFRVASIGSAQRRRLARTGRLTLRVRTPQGGTIRLRSNQGPGRAVRVGGATTRRVTFRLSKAARRALARRGRLSVRIVVRFGDSRRVTTFVIRSGK